MSVLDTEIVDYVYLEDGVETPVLVVSDPLGWAATDQQEHMAVLREKLNTQIAFVESGQINGVWPPYDGRIVRVEVIGRHALSERAKEFYAMAREVMDNANIDLRFHLCDA